MLLAQFALYTGASLLHFVHNAEFLDSYPNLPEWLTRAQVYGAWLAVFAVGVLGLLVLRRGFQRFGLGLLMVYAALGFAGLDHYLAAPISAHTPVMNFTIFFEVATACLLLLYLLAQLFRTIRSPQPG